MSLIDCGTALGHLVIKFFPTFSNEVCVILDILESKKWRVIHDILKARVYLVNHNRGTFVLIFPPVSDNLEQFEGVLFFRVKLII